MRLAWREQGICTKCGTQPARPGLHQCQRCTDTAKRWRLDHPEQVRSYARATYKRRNKALCLNRRRWYATKREAALRAYGGKCQCCGEEHVRFLEIDHIEGKRPEGKKKKDIKLWSWLQVNNWPPGFRVLCRNCNWAVRFGLCPHQERRVN